MKIGEIGLVIILTLTIIAGTIGLFFNPTKPHLDRIPQPNQVRFNQHLSCVIEQQEAWLAIVRDNQHRPEYIISRWKVRSSVIQASLQDMATANRNYLYR